MGIIDKIIQYVDRGRSEGGFNGGGDSIESKGERRDVVESMLIPEPTRSLLWTTREDPSHIEHVSDNNIVLTPNGITTRENDGFYAEPSLIWEKLPIKRTDELENSPIYWPEYSKFSPEMRYQYLMWLRDITKDTNLSFVFLYFYGLERHLLVGDYDAAVDEISRLMKYHPAKSFINYASCSLVVSSLVRGRKDIIERVPQIMSEENNETLALRIANKSTMTSDDVISISGRVGFSNSRYIKLYPEAFKRELQRCIRSVEQQIGCGILGYFKLEDFETTVSDVFANLSIPRSIRKVRIPIIIGDKKFDVAMRKLLQAAHDQIKMMLKNGELDRFSVQRRRKREPVDNEVLSASNKEVDSLISQLDVSNDIEDLHFEIMYYIQEHYKTRNNIDDYHKAVVGCFAQIKIQRLVANQMLRKYPGQSLPEHTGYKQLAIIFEKEGRLNDAVRIAEEAAANGWSGDWQRRIGRLSKRIAKMR